MRRPHAAAAVVVLLWLAVLTVAFHGCGGRSHGCGGLVAAATTKRLSSSVSLSRKMLLDVTSFDAAPSPAADHHHHHHHHHRHHQHHHHEHHHHHAGGQWNRQGIPPSLPAGKNGEGVVDTRYGVEKRLVPTGPNPLHH